MTKNLFDTVKSMEFAAENYLTPLKQAFQKNRHPEKAYQMEKYMRFKFPYYGIQQPLRKEIWKAFKQSNPLPESRWLNDVVKKLWEYQEREYQMVALDVLFESRKTWKKDQIQLLEQLIVDKSWWDTVDMLASNLVGYYFQMFPSETYKFTGQWNESENVWLNRSSILFQLKYKDATDFELLKKYILNHTETDEFFIQKAIGWSLREYAKTDARKVLRFVDENSLPALSRREALKNIK